MEIISTYSRKYQAYPDIECVIVLGKILYQYVIIASYKGEEDSDNITSYSDFYSYDNIDEATLKFEELQG